VTVVITDASPLRYLILIDEVGILEKLFGAVIVPAAVLDELRHPNAPKIVREWAGNVPSWVEIRSGPEIESPWNLGPGEREAIGLALSLKAALLIIDDWLGRRLAVDRGLKVTGTLGILERAARAGMIDLSSTLSRLEKTNIRITEALKSEMVERVQAFKNAQRNKS
jgi:predicted nucleic acid-binding protein